MLFLPQPPMLNHPGSTPDAAAQLQGLVGVGSGEGQGFGRASETVISSNGDIAEGTSGPLGESSPLGRGDAGAQLTTTGNAEGSADIQMGTNAISTMSNVAGGQGGTSPPGLSITQLGHASPQGNESQSQPLVSRRPCLHVGASC